MFDIRRADDVALSRRAVGAFVAGGIAVAVLLVTVVAPMASSDPDGLERVAIDEGFADNAEEHALDDSPLADYQVGGVENDRVSTAAAGLVGMAATFVLGAVLVLLARRRRQPAQR